MDWGLEARHAVKAHSLDDLIEGVAIAISVRDVLGGVSHYLPLHAFDNADMSSPVLERVPERMEHETLVANAAFLPVAAEPFAPLRGKPLVLVRLEVGEQALMPQRLLMLHKPEEAAPDEIAVNRHLSHASSIFDL